MKKSQPNFGHGQIMTAQSSPGREPQAAAKGILIIENLETDLATIQLEIRLKLLNQKYSQLLRKEKPTYEELNELLVELRKITSNGDAIRRVDNHQKHLDDIKQKVVQLKEENKLVKGSTQEIQRESGLSFAIQHLMKRNDDESYYSDDEEESDSEDMDLQDRLINLEWQLENLWEKEKLTLKDWDEVNNIFEELQQILKTKHADRVENYQGYLESIKAKFIRISDAVQNVPVGGGETEIKPENLSTPQSTTVDAQNKVDELNAESMRALLQIRIDLTKYKTKIGARLVKAVEKMETDNAYRSPDLVPLIKDFQKMRKKLKSIIKAAKTYQAAILRLEDARAKVSIYNIIMC